MSTDDSIGRYWARTGRRYLRCDGCAEARLDTGSLTPGEHHRGCDGSWRSETIAMSALDDLWLKWKAAEAAHDAAWDTGAARADKMAAFIAAAEARAAYRDAVEATSETMT